MRMKYRVMKCLALLLSIVQFVVIDQIAANELQENGIVELPSKYSICFTDSVLTKQDGICASLWSDKWEDSSKFDRF